MVEFKKEKICIGMNTLRVNLISNKKKKKLVVAWERAGVLCGALIGIKEDFKDPAFQIGGKPLFSYLFI